MCSGASTEQEKNGNTPWSTTDNNSSPTACSSRYGQSISTQMEKLDREWRSQTTKWSARCSEEGNPVAALDQKAPAPPWTSIMSMGSNTSNTTAYMRTQEHAQNRQDRIGLQHAWHNMDWMVQSVGNKKQNSCTKGQSQRSKNKNKPT